MSAFLIVFLGAGLGGMLRHGVNLGCARLCGTDFPWGTMTVNILGSLAMGLIAGWLAFRAGESWTQHVRLFLTTGILGGFTTFSAFSLDAMLLWERGQTSAAIAYVLVSVLVSVLALAAGLALVRTLS
ncbi:fluoride efflux transporter CrcB [Roseiarcaceae bacterium H3SJ34-1]|uniref:fluoride efflux transporter CrcB n=1 Tax=Terripilifer ovatus TaxID=3032367 RepID=UPI003AB98B81|nr:fluoride efflux transporter CrcB [Roseiarcaceae bacterium H3SJ34-1]